MRNDITFTVSDIIVTLTGETRTFATVKLGDGREFTGEVGSPVGAPCRNAWMDDEVARGIDAIECSIDRDDVMRMLKAEMS